MTRKYVVIVLILSLNCKKLNEITKLDRIKLIYYCRLTYLNFTILKFSSEHSLRKKTEVNSKEVRTIFRVVSVFGARAFQHMTSLNMNSDRTKFT